MVRQAERDATASVLTAFASPGQPTHHAHGDPMTEPEQPPAEDHPLMEEEAAEAPYHRGEPAQPEDYDQEDYDPDPADGDEWLTSQRERRSRG